VDNFNVLLESDKAGTEERLALMAAVRALSEISASGDADVIPGLAKKI
jgi:hypothetical protein